MIEVDLFSFEQHCIKYCHLTNIPGVKSFKKLKIKKLKLLQMFFVKKYMDTYHSEKCQNFKIISEVTSEAVLQNGCF